MTQSSSLAHPSGFSYPDINVPVMDRCIARLKDIPVLEQIVRSSGLKPCLQSTFPDEQCDRVLQRLSTERLLQLFSEDARNESQLLFSLLLNKPVLLERILRRLYRRQQQWILQLFGECPPAISDEIATSCALLLTRLQDPLLIAPVLITLLRNSETTTKAAALQGLFEGGALNFGLLMTLAKKLTPESEEHSAPGQELIALTLQQARKQRNIKLTNHLHIYVALIYRSMPRYQQYWAQCTNLPVSSCPVMADSSALKASLSQLTQELVSKLYRSKDEDSLLSLTARKGWRNIQPRSTATLCNSEPVIGDFIFRTFLSLLATAFAGQPEIIVEPQREEESQLQLSQN